MTSRAKGAAQSSAPAVRWYTLPLDEEGRIPSGAPKCQDGDEILCRVYGEAEPCTVVGRAWIRDEDGKDVSHLADAIAHPLPKASSGRTRSYRERQRAGLTRVSAELDERTLRRLDELCDYDGGISRADMIRSMIDGSWAEMREVKPTG